VNILKGSDLTTMVNSESNIDLISFKDIQSYIPDNDKIDSRIFSRLLDEDKVVASYKMYWILGILDEVSEGNTEIDFKRIIARMIVNAWYPQRQFKLSFGIFDNLKNSINYVASNYGFPPNCKENELLDFVYISVDKELQKRMKELTNHVPYRLLSPFFTSELRGVKDNLKNKIITELSMNSNSCLYKIIKGKPDKIVINDGWKDYLQENYKIIKAWIYCKLVRFLQKRNPNVPAIIFKLEAPKVRKLTKVTELWRKIIIDKGVCDIYTGEEFKNDTFKEFGVLSIDHFIPWSFVLHDEMWNLVPTFKNINSRKSDNLLSFNQYIQDFCNAQYKAFSYICDKKIGSVVEDYMDVLKIDNPYDYYRHSNPEIFSSGIKKCISPLYQIAVNQGFQVVDRVFNI